MLTAVGILFSCLLVIVALTCWLLGLIGLPGAWILVAVAALDAWLVPESYMAHLPWWSVLVLAGIAGLGEIIEFATSALGVGKLGGSRRAALLALVGSMGGAIIGIFISLPIPVVGPILGAILFSGIGALAGAWIGELWEGSEAGKSLKIGLAAFLGRVLGTVGKSLCTGMMVAVVTVLVFQ